MRIVYIKIVAIFVVGIVALGAFTVFAGDPVPGLDITIEQIPGGKISSKNYNSSLSSKSTAQVREGVGNVLLRYGVGGSEINQITGVLEGSGVYEAELKSFLLKIGINESDAQAILVEFDKLGIAINEEGLQAVSALSAGEAVSSPAAEADVIKEPLQPTGEVSISDTGSVTKGIGEVEIAVEKIERGEISTAAGTEVASRSATGEIKILTPERKILAPDAGDGEPTPTVRKRPGRVKYGDITLKRGLFHDAAINVIQNIRSAAPEEKEGLIDELRASRETLRTEIVSMSLGIRDNAKALRDNFRDNVITIKSEVAPKLCGAVCIGRIAVAHGKGLRMLNRFRSAMARFDHILNRLESRVLKLKERGFQVDSFFDVETSIEEAKNMSIENAAKMEELKAKYESFLEGENLQGVAGEAREIAKELKTEIENLHTKLRAIVDGIKNNIGIGEEGVN